MLIFGSIHKSLILTPKQTVLTDLHTVHYIMEEILECSQEKTIQVSDREWQICQLTRKISFLAQKPMNHSSPGHRTHPTLINPVG